MTGAEYQSVRPALRAKRQGQRELHTTLGRALTELLDRPPTTPPMDHGAFAMALAPSLASAVAQMSGPKKVDPGRPGTEPFRSSPRPDLKPLPAAAEVKESELFDLTEFDPQIRRENLHRRFYSLELRTNEHAHRVVDHIVNHLNRTPLDLLPGYATYIPHPGEITEINDKLGWSLLGRAGGSNRNFVPAGTIGERPPVYNDGRNEKEIDWWYDNYWQSQVAMYTPADRSVFVQSLCRTVDQAVRRMFRMLHMHEAFQLPLVAIDTNPPPGRSAPPVFSCWRRRPKASPRPTPTRIPTAVGNIADTQPLRFGHMHPPCVDFTYGLLRP